MPASMPVSITVVSDVVCPWCFVGKRQLALALADVPQEHYTVEWRPHQLDPSISEEGVDRKTDLARKFPDSGKLFAIQQTLMEVASGVGLQFNLGDIKKTPNTLNAHRLIHWARGQQRDTAMVERLMTAYFIEGRDVGDVPILATLAQEVGLESDLVGNLLRGDADRTVVQDDIAKYRELGVTGVPCFIFGGTVAVMGAQSPDILRRAFDQVRAVLAVDA
jgi:predicted DsbA family dithiol-disulfide isomerase